MKLLLGVIGWCSLSVLTAAEKPNVIFVLVDNLGNGDVKCFNPKSLHNTPNLDRMAAEGMKLTSFYSVSGVCSPSRAGAMTGCYPQRVNLHRNHDSRGVLRPVSPKGLHPDETTMAEVLKAAGYATKIIGKWHLGDQPEFLPTRQGFDSYFGIPYSDDMTRDKRPEEWPELPLMRDEKVIEAPAERETLTQRYTAEAIQWIREKKEQPFFLYLPHAMPGSTPAAYASAAFQGKSANGKWGDSVEELDWSMGEILRVLKAEGLDDKTLVVWTSDNGAPKRNPPQGSNAPYQGWGYGTSEGGMRMPCLVRWPGKIPHDERGFFYYLAEQLQAVRSGPWKLYLGLEKKAAGLGDKTQPFQPQLFDVRNDVAETKEVSVQHPDVVARLNALAEAAREELGDVGRPGKGQREAGWVEKPTGRVVLPAAGR